MATKRLAKELGLLRQRSSSTSGPKKQIVTNQVFSYIIVIDFESTCWKEKNNYGQEIIEFPAVLLNTSTGEVESEFHSYVQPQEHPVLSDFCTELTGISQAQVEAGLPLQICLSRFSRWIQTLQHQKGLVFPNAPQQSAPPTASNKLCTFLTWSDWDLGVCLLYECKRKQIHKPRVLNSWIDLRSTYRMFYNRKPKGLNGALQDLGIQFEGREHSGLDDARNTAQLAARMTRDGCVLRTTRSLDRIPITSIKVPPATKEPMKQLDTKDSVSTSKSPTSTNIHKPGFNAQTPTLNSTKISVQSLVSPKTLLNGTIIAAEACKTTTTSTNLSTICVNVATSDSGRCVSIPQHSDTSESPFEELIVEGEERCSSYDDVILDDVTEDMSEFETSEEKLYHCARKQSLTTSGILQKSKVRFSNFQKPKVLVPTTPLMQKYSNKSISRSGLPNLSTNASRNRILEGPFDEIIVESDERCGSYDDVVLYDVAEDCTEFERARHTSEELNYTATFLENSSFSCITSNDDAKQPVLERCFALPKSVSRSRQCVQKETSTTSSLLNKSVISFRNLPKHQILVSNTPLKHKPFKQAFSNFTEREDPDSAKVLPNLSTNTSWNKTSESPSDELIVEDEGRCSSLDKTEDFSEFEIARHLSEESTYTAKLFMNSRSGCNGNRNIKGDAKKPGLESRFALPNTVSKLQSYAQKELPTTSSLLHPSEISLRNLPKPRVLVSNTPLKHKPSKQSFSNFSAQEDPGSSKSRLCNVLPNLSTNTSWNKKSANPLDGIIVEGEESCSSLVDENENISEFKNARHPAEELACAGKLFVNSSSRFSASRNIKGDAKKPGLERCFALPNTVSKFQRCGPKESPTTSALQHPSEINLRNKPMPQVLVPNTPLIHKSSKQSFSIFTEQEDSRLSKSHISTSVLSNLSINTSLNRTSIGGGRRGECRITSPLCSCGRRAKRQLVSNGGPNQGRAFFCCPGKRSGGGAKAQNRCDFFKWESALMPKSGPGTVAAAGSSVSMCQSRTGVSGQLERSLRKSF